MNLRTTGGQVLKGIVALAATALLNPSLRAQATDAHSRAAAASNAFALKAYEQLSATDTNLVFCPFSMHRLLSLALEGAQGKTADELNRCLHWTGTPQERHESLRALGTTLGASMQQGLLTLQTTNRLWLSNRGSLDADFHTLATGLYGAKTESLDFKNPGRAVAYMNAVIGGDTQGRVTQLLPASAVNPDTTLVMANTVFFKGLWFSPFKKERTAERPFLPLGQMKTKPCVTMMQTSRLAAYEDQEVQVLDMPFSGAESLSMMFFLPVKRGELMAFEKTLNAERIQQIAGDMQGRRVTAYVPKFSFSVGGGYGAILAHLGARRVFDLNLAELQGIATAARPHLSEIWHETTIQINEVGGQAAAATAAPADPFGPADAPPAQPLERAMVFNADHPFLFLVRHHGTGLVLFMGRFAGP